MASLIPVSQPLRVEYLPSPCDLAWEVIPFEFHQFNLADPAAPSRLDLISSFADALDVRKVDIISTCETLVALQEEISNGFFRLKNLFDDFRLLPHIHQELNRMEIPFAFGKESLALYKVAFRERSFLFWKAAVFPKDGFLSGAHFKMNISNLLRFPIRKDLPKYFREECEKYAEIFPTIPHTPGRLRVINLCRQEEISLEEVSEIFHPCELDIFDFQEGDRKKVVEEKFLKIFAEDAESQELRSLQEISIQIPIEFGMDLKVRCLSGNLIKQCRKLVQRFDRLDVHSGNVQDKISALQAFATAVRRTGPWADRFNYVTTRYANQLNFKLENMYKENVSKDNSLAFEIDQLAETAYGWANVFHSPSFPAIWSSLLLEALPLFSESIDEFLDTAMCILSDHLHHHLRLHIHQVFMQIVNSGRKFAPPATYGSVEQAAMIRAYNAGTLTALVDALKVVRKLELLQDLASDKNKLKKELVALIKKYVFSF